MILPLLIVAVLFLAWSNGANDNFKGVATLYGSGTCGFRTALVWATASTFAGSLVSVALATTLVKAFSGSGLIPAQLIAPPLLAAVAGAAALTILLATLVGMPTSTTHALTGALVGAGLAAAGAASVDWGRLGAKFAVPLLLSPLLAIAGAALAYLILRSLRRRAGVERETCLCVGTTTSAPVALPAGAAALVAVPTGGIEVAVGETPTCRERYLGRILGIQAQHLVDLTHYASSSAVCFARAVNDTPKIAALLLAATALTGEGVAWWGLGLVALAMAVGGWLQARRVAETMSLHITDLNPGQGLTANLVTAGLVLGASNLGVPVSTTHVSCGAIFGIGLVNRRGERRTIAQILATWGTTLPLGLGLGAAFYLLLA